MEGTALAKQEALLSYPTPRPPVVMLAQALCIFVPNSTHQNCVDQLIRPNSSFLAPSLGHGHLKHNWPQIEHLPPSISQVMATVLLGAQVKTLETSLPPVFLTPHIVSGQSLCSLPSERILNLDTSLNLLYNFQPRHILPGLVQQLTFQPHLFSPQQSD